MDRFPALERRHLRYAPIYIAVPAYKEGLGILKLLKSISEIQDDGPLYLYIFVNGPLRDAEQKNEAYFDNLASYIACKAYAKGWTLKNSQSKIKSPPKLKVEVIDSFSKEKAHPTMNVGKARKLLMDKIIKDSSKLDYPDAIVISMDADESIGPKLITLVRKYYSEMDIDFGPLPIAVDLKDADGKTTFAGKLYDTHLKNSRTFEKAIHYLSKKQRLFEEYKEMSEGERPSCGGGFSSFLLSAYKESGGYPELDGAEDIGLSFKLYNAGKQVGEIIPPYNENANHYLIKTPLRLSDRTGLWDGMGQEMLRVHNGQLSQFKRSFVIGKIMTRLQSMLQNESDLSKIISYLKRLHFPQESIAVIVKELESLRLHDPWQEVVLDEGLRKIHFEISRQIERQGRINPIKSIELLLALLSKVRLKVSDKCTSDSFCHTHLSSLPEIEEFQELVVRQLSKRNFGEKEKEFLYFFILSHIAKKYLDILLAIDALFVASKENESRTQNKSRKEDNELDIMVQKISDIIISTIISLKESVAEEARKLSEDKVAYVNELIESYKESVTI